METVQLTSGIGSFKGPSSKKVRVSCIEASRVGFSSTKKKCFLRLVTKAATVAAPKPLVDRVLPKIRTAEENTCEILLPSTTKTKSQGSELVTSGEGMTLGKSKIDINDKAGFKVVYFKHAGTEVNFNGSRHLILEEDDIVAIIETEDIKDLKPLNNNVLIKVTEAKSKAASEATYEIQQDDTLADIIKTCSTTELAGLAVIFSIPGFFIVGTVYNLICVVRSIWSMRNLDIQMRKDYELYMTLMNKK